MAAHGVADQAQALPVGTCFAVFAGLVLLTAITVGAAFLDLWVFSTPIALTIATAKALFVMLYFMELRHSQKLVWVFIGAGILWFLVLVGPTIADYASRGWLGVPGK
jgi:cytochrome c oxidase subunit 4